MRVRKGGEGLENATDAVILGTCDRANGPQEANRALGTSGRVQHRSVAQIDICAPCDRHPFPLSPLPLLSSPYYLLADEVGQHIKRMGALSCLHILGS